MIVSSAPDRLSHRRAELVSTLRHVLPHSKRSACRKILCSSAFGFAAALAAKPNCLVGDFGGHTQGLIPTVISQCPKPTGDNAAVESSFALLQKNILNRKFWATGEELRIAWGHGSNGRTVGVKIGSDGGHLPSSKPSGQQQPNWLTNHCHPSVRNPTLNSSALPTTCSLATMTGLEEASREARSADPALIRLVAPSHGRLSHASEKL